MPAFTRRNHSIRRLKKSAVAHSPPRFFCEVVARPCRANRVGCLVSYFLRAGLNNRSVSRFWSSTTICRGVVSNPTLWWVESWGRKPLDRIKCCIRTALCHLRKRLNRQQKVPAWFKPTTMVARKAKSPMPRVPKHSRMPLQKRQPGGPPWSVTDNPLNPSALRPTDLCGRTRGRHRRRAGCQGRDGNRGIVFPQRDRRATAGTRRVRG